MNCSFGKPGTSAMARSKAPVASSAGGCAISCSVICVPRLSASSRPDTRVIRMPAAMETNSDGTCATMPSPIVSTV